MANSFQNTARGRSKQSLEEYNYGAGWLLNQQITICKHTKHQMKNSR